MISPFKITKHSLAGDMPIPTKIPESDDEKVRLAASAGCAALVAAGGAPGIICGIIVNPDMMMKPIGVVLDKLGISAKGYYDYLTVPETIQKYAYDLLNRTAYELYEIDRLERIRLGLGVSPNKPENIASSIVAWSGFVDNKKGNPTGDGVVYLDSSRGAFGIRWTGWPQPPSDQDVRQYRWVVSHLFETNRFPQLIIGARKAERFLAEMRGADLAKKRVEDTLSALQKAVNKAAAEKAAADKAAADKAAADKAAADKAAADKRARAEVSVNKAKSARTAVILVGVVGLAIGVSLAMRKKR